MVKFKHVLALIPARGGSKSIPRKNIYPFAGHPLIACSIRAAKASEAVTRIIVSTDDVEIAEISKKYGAEVPFLRPAEFSQDETPDLPVFQHALGWLAEYEGYKPEVIVQLRPTSPLRKVVHITQAIHTLSEYPSADSVRTVCIPFQNPYKMWKINEEGYMQPIIETALKEAYNMPRQMLPTVYWQTGYVDVAWFDTIMQKNSMTGTRILPLIIEPNEWVDIDSPDDWRRAENLLKSGDINFNELGFKLEIQL